MQAPTEVTTLEGTAELLALLQEVPAPSVRVDLLPSYYGPWLERVQETGSQFAAKLFAKDYTKIGPAMGAIEAALKADLMADLVSESSLSTTTVRFYNVQTGEKYALVTGGNVTLHHINVYFDPVTMGCTIERSSGLVTVGVEAWERSKYLLSALWSMAKATLTLGGKFAKVCFHYFVVLLCKLGFNVTKSEISRGLLNFVNVLANLLGIRVFASWDEVLTFFSSAMSDLSHIALNEATKGWNDLRRFLEEHWQALRKEVGEAWDKLQDHAANAIRRAIEWGFTQLLRLLGAVVEFALARDK